MSAPTDQTTAVPAGQQRPPRLGLAAAARCRRRIHLDFDPDSDKLSQRQADDGLQLRLDTLAAHKRDIYRRLSVGMTLPEGWRPADSSRPAVVWGARLAGGNRFATIDLLLKMRDGGYVPVLVRGHRTTDPGRGARLSDVADLLGQGASADRAAPLPVRVDPGKKLRSHHRDSLALAHAYRLLQDLGLASAEKVGGIIGFGGPAADIAWDDGAVIAWHRLDAPAGNGAVLAEYDARFADRLLIAQAAAQRRPALAQPSRIAECRRCPWWAVCGPELEAAHDVSLLVAGGDVEILREAGAATYDDVARMDPAVLAALPLTGIPAAEARTRARAMLAGVPMVRRFETVDVVRADVELDVDMESYLDDGAYLWGTYLTGRPVPGFGQGYRPFATWEPLDTAAAAANFVHFWRYLTALRAACDGLDYSFAAFCYSHKAEERWLYGTPARFPGEPGMPTHADVAAFCASPQWVDVYTEVTRLFVVPGSRRLKAVAPVAGFAWRDPEPGGENSMAWYRAATAVSRGAAPERADITGAAAYAEKDVIPDAESNRTRILRYNEDDVRATWALRQWMSSEPTAMPTVAELERR